jgi:hypothetical protein
MNTNALAALAFGIGIGIGLAGRLDLVAHGAVVTTSDGGFGAMTALLLFGAVFAIK